MAQAYALREKSTQAFFNSFAKDSPEFFSDTLPGNTMLLSDVLAFAQLFNDRETAEEMRSELGQGFEVVGIGIIAEVES
nr:MAG TPA: hypothetical protein [Caudoviricetes sp.]